MMRNASCQNILTILTYMVEMKTLHEVFDRSIDHWMQSTLVMHICRRRVLKSAPFTKLVTSFAKLRVNKTVKEQHILTKAKSSPPLDLNDFWPHPSSISSPSKKDKRTRNKRVRRKPQVTKKGHRAREQIVKEQ